MPIYNVVFNSAINTSAAVGDNVYIVDISQTGGPDSFFVGGLGSILMIGVIINMTNPEGLIPNVPISIEIDYTGTPPLGSCTVYPLCLVSNGSFLIFSKDKSANTSGIKGYYAKAKFINNSREKAELFSVGTEIALSSK